ncbi:MAG: ACT domain-containing protein [Acidimicrobiales bacterium]
MTDDAQRRHLLLTVVVPDRPGALGAVASRIGALGADITDIMVGGRGRGTVHDTFHLDLPSSRVDLVTLLLGELSEVDGIMIESWHEASCCSDRSVDAGGMGA